MTINMFLYLACLKFTYLAIVCIDRAYRQGCILIIIIIYIIIILRDIDDKMLEYSKACNKDDLSHDAPHK